MSNPFRSLLGEEEEKSMKDEVCDACPSLTLKQVQNQLYPFFLDFLSFFCFFEENDRFWHLFRHRLFNLLPGSFPFFFFSFFFDILIIILLTHYPCRVQWLCWKETKTAFEPLPFYTSSVTSSP